MGQGDSVTEFSWCSFSRQMRHCLQKIITVSLWLPLLCPSARPKPALKATSNVPQKVPTTTKLGFHDSVAPEEGFLLCSWGALRQP